MNHGVRQPIIFHIAGRDDWDGHGLYSAASLADEGFIHCSTPGQVAGVANALFADRGDLVLLCVDTSLLTGPLRYEGPDFPHVYGPIDAGAIVDVVPFPARDGVFTLPWEASTIARRPPATFAELRDRVRVFSTFPHPWWIGGGWAIDLWLGEIGRPHEDIDITVRARDLDALRTHLATWDLRVPLGEDQPLLRLVPGEPSPAPDQHQIWARPEPASDAIAPVEFAADPEWLDILLEDVGDDEWRYRRDHRIRRPLAEYGAVTADGIPYVRPEVQLLFKSKAHPTGDDRNERDLARSLTRLDRSARTWLHDALSVVDPKHPWLARLGG